MSTLVVLASTAFGLATAVAALGSPDLAEARRRILVVADTTPMPEAGPPMTDVGGVTHLHTRFARVHDYNAAIEPQHPSAWQPRTADLPILERHLRALWDLGDDEIHLLVESIQVSPARTLCRIFADARITVYADGLMSYGPTRSPMPAQVGGRVERLLHLDLVPGVVPLLLREWQVPAAHIPTAEFRAVVAQMANRTDTGGLPRGATVLLGQYLAAAGLLSESEEDRLYQTMVLRCAEAGLDRLVFKPHPSAPRAQADRLRAGARERGLEVSVADRPGLVECWLEAGLVGAVVGCFSTGLVTAQTLYGVPAHRVGTKLLLERLSPYENSNRMPVTLVDATVPDAAASGPTAPRPDAKRLSALVGAVGYAMQPELLAPERPAAAAFLARHYPDHARYFKRRRLTRLDLPGRLPAGTPLRRIRRVAHRLVRRPAALRRGA